MAYKVSSKYKELRYSGDNDNQLYLEYDGVEFENAPLKTENLKWVRRILDNGSKTLTLDNFVSQTIELIIRDYKVSDTTKEFYIKIGSMVDGAYEYVPLGYYHIKDNPSTANGKTTYKLTDRSTRFDKYVDLSSFIEQNGGKITKLQTVQEYCRQCGVEFANTSFLGSDEEIGVYDNTITARVHIMYLAECSGCIATIGRDGKLYFIPLVKPSTDNTHIIPERILNNNMNNSKGSFRISKVIWEGALMPFEKGDDTGDTLFVNTSNLYISKQEDIDRIYNQVVGLEIDNISTSSIIGDPSIDPWDYIKYTHTDDEGNDKETFTSLAQYDLTFNGVFKQTFNTSIDREKKKINSTLNSPAAKMNKLRQDIDAVNGTLKVTSEKVDGNTERIGQLELANSSIKLEVKEKVDIKEIIASLNLAIENEQGVVKFVSNQFLVDADNLKIDQYGSVKMSKAQIVGGNIELFDDGTRDGSSIKIHTKTDYGTSITLGTDLSNKILLFNFDENTIFPQDIEPRKYYTLLKSSNFQIQLFVIDQSGLNKTITYHLYYNYLDSSFRNKIATIRHYTDGTPNTITKIISDLQLNETAGIVSELSDYELTNEIVITDQIDKITNISGYGIDTIIAPRFNYTFDDMAYIMEKLDTGGTFSKHDIFKYDLNLDGVIDMDDYYNVQWFVLNDITVENPARLKINTQNAKDNLVLTDGYGTDRVAIDFSGIRFKGNTHLSIINGFDEEVISVGSDGIYIDKNLMSDLCQNKILWQADPGYYMTAQHTVVLNEKISEQAHGIILVWWGYNPTEKKLVGGPVSTQVIPKTLISETEKTSFFQGMHYSNFEYSGTKNVDIYDNKIVGDNANAATGTGNSGIKYSNNRFVLRYIIGF